ncbi:low specificity L-threonine aldolase [Roseomonas sp. 18066]|uniref:threonine aldolase family protein n=1 Tax=Roseomonas sp. 18066 TaxID=2681412 RepID=UPI00135B68A3|nr:beta-eliminating lyase-related protein [Roseomonas sp. 18066]
MQGDFQSDNVAGIHPAIMAALAAANHGTATPYGLDDSARALNDRFSAFFGAAVTVFPVSTGTAANTFALSACLRPYAGAFCHEGAHLRLSEGNSLAAAGGGAALIGLPGALGRIDPAALREAVAQAPRGNTQKPQPAAVTVTQATERGTVYSLDALAAIGACAKENGLLFHMDGARFANAQAWLGCSAPAMTSGIGLDLLSFGATKNGVMSTDALVVFRPELVEPVAFTLRRAGQTWSKMRFAAAQLQAYVAGDLHLALARRANALAARLGEGLSRLPGGALLAPVEANIVFATLPPAMIDALQAQGFSFYRRGAGEVRLVCRFDQPEAEISALLAAAGAA